MTKQAEPRRLRWSVPPADTSTNKWLDQQYDISRSVQLLIRESIQRDGYIDVVNRPVEQLPRRGRPPGDAGQDGAQGWSSQTQGDDSPAVGGPRAHRAVVSADQHGTHDESAVEPAAERPGTDEPQGPEQSPRGADAAAGIAEMLDMR